MKQYRDLATLLFTIKKTTLPTLTTINNRNNPMFANDLAKQLREDLDNLKAELFGNKELTALETKELKKINEKITVKFSALKRKFEKSNRIAI